MIRQSKDLVRVTIGGVNSEQTYHLVQAIVENPSIKNFKAYKILTEAAINLVAKSNNITTFSTCSEVYKGRSRHYSEEIISESITVIRTALETGENHNLHQVFFQHSPIPELEPLLADNRQKATRVVFADVSETEHKIEPEQPDGKLLLHNMAICPLQTTRPQTTNRPSLTCYVI
ncbi:MAG: hypothetical protein FWF23_03410 [Alphaproteobacteria bacterium]|nr:hypothetical protein [Alphaproteobacteria bacterium]MCL2505088.1 hypothetical protein [Alphaproteobacteria bacterium]